MHTRLQDVTVDLIKADTVAIYSTHLIDPPPHLAHVWRHVNEGHKRGQLSEEEMYRLSHTALVLLFSDIDVGDHAMSAYSVTEAIVALGPLAPPVVLVPHSRAPELRSTDAADEDRELFCLTGARNVYDSIIIGEPSGPRLAADISSRIMQLSSKVSQLNDKLNARRDRLRYVQDVEELNHDIVWNYLRVRIKSNVPDIDYSFGPGIPERVDNLYVGRKLGEGSFGMVCRLTSSPGSSASTSQQVLKIVDKESMTNFHGIASLRRQMHTMEVLQMHPHPNITQLYQVYHTPTHLLFRMEDAGPVDLYKRMSLRDLDQLPMSLYKTATMLVQSIDAICHLHLVPKVVHRDLKPENIIVYETPHTIMIKLTDFDTSQQVARPGALVRGKIGTFPFMAPEVLRDRQFEPFAADIWSMAAVFLEIFCRLNIVKKVLEIADWPKNVSTGAKREFERRAMEDIHKFFAKDGSLDMILDKSFRQDLGPLFASARTLLGGCLNVVPPDRWTAEKLRDEHRDHFAVA
jgi:hypothetical protein